MTAKLRDLVIHATATKRGSLDSPFARAALGRREAKRLALILEEAEKRAKVRLDAARFEAERELQAAQLDAEDILACARAEATALLAMLPDFAAIEAVPAAKGRTAMQIIRNIADRDGLAIAAVVGRSHNERAKAARIEAVKAVAEAFPDLLLKELGAMFGGRAPCVIYQMLRRR